MIRFDTRKIVSDKEAAALYGVSLARVRQAVKRHPTRFPPDLIVKKGEDEYAFPLAGLLMLSSILKTPQAVQVSIDLIRELFSFKNN